MNNFLGLNLISLFKDYLFCKKNRPPKIYDALTTIELIKNKKLSVARFGDGEFDLIMNINHPKFQKEDAKLSNKLSMVLNSKDDRVMICIPNVFRDSLLDSLTGKASRHWKRFLMKNREQLYILLDRDKQYGDALFTRHYIDEKNKHECKTYFDNIKQLWNKRDVVLIEGRYTRFGVGNDLLDNATSVSRILCPEKDAFAMYDLIYDAAMKQDKNSIFLLALGPTATVLAYDLTQKGCQAIDIGHLDIEYEWLLRNASKKIKINNKYVNEADGILDENNDCLHDAKYQSTIVERIF